MTAKPVTLAAVALTAALSPTNNAQFPCDLAEFEAEIAGRTPTSIRSEIETVELFSFASPTRRNP